MRLRIAPRRPRAGLTYLELQVAVALLGVLLAGLAPIVLAQLRLIGRIERRVYCLVPLKPAPEATTPDAALVADAGSTLIALPDGGRVAPEATWSRRLGLTRSRLRLVAIDLDAAVRPASGGRHRDLILSATDGLPPARAASWRLRLDPSRGPVPTWSDATTGIALAPSPLGDYPPPPGASLAVESVGTAEITITRD